MCQSITRSPNHLLARFPSVALRHFVAATAVLALAAYIILYGRLDAAPIKSDGYSYYVYLPSWFIYKDISLEALAADWYGGSYPSFTGLRRWPSTGHWINLHPIGTALLETPFFIVADVLSRWSNMPRDGFSIYYQHAAGLAGLAYFIAGIAILRRILMRHFSDGVVLATMVCLTWGTNLFHYGVFDGTFSHAFAFFEICAWLWLAEQWWIGDTDRRSLMLGAIAGLIVVTRHTNAVFLLLLPLMGVARAADLRRRAREMWHRRRSLLLAAAAGAAIAAPQLALYRWTTGSWFVNAYLTHSPIGFRFASPHLAQVLFSTQKGLFFWSPLLLLAAIGLVSGRAARAFPPSSLGVTRDDPEPAEGSATLRPTTAALSAFARSAPARPRRSSKSGVGREGEQAAGSRSGESLALPQAWVSELRLAVAIVLGIQTYLIASWSEWQFGASYGHRAFTDGLGIMAVFLAAFFERIASRRYARATVAIGATAAVLLSVAQMIQYWIGILPYADTTWSQYRALFLHFR